MKYNNIGVNLNTEKLLFEDKKLDEFEYGKLENANLIMTLDLFTIINNKNELKKILYKIKYNKYKLDLNKIKYNKNIDVYECYFENDKVIRFNLLSNIIQDADKNVIKELESNDRKGKCYDSSIYVGNNILNSTILTGYIKFLNEKYLHSVVMVNDKIIDWTRNLVMDKDQYFDLFNFELLNSIESNNILENLIKLYGYGLNGIDLKMFLLFNDEIFNDISKNQEIFDNYLDNNEDSLKLLKRYHK